MYGKVWLKKYGEYWYFAWNHENPLHFLHSRNDNVVKNPINVKNNVYESVFLCTAQLNTRCHNIMSVRGLLKNLSDNQSTCDDRYRSISFCRILWCQ